MGNRQSRPWVVSDELWSLVQPLLPKPGPKKVQGRLRVPDRQALCGILLVLHTGIQWEYLPQELGFGSGMTCWRRLAAWNEAGVRGRLHQLLLNELRSKDRLDWERGGDRLLARAGRPTGPKSGPSPVDRARPGSRHHLVVDGQGIPLAVSLTGGNRNDVTQLEPLLDKIPAVAGRVGRPRRRPDALLADRGYDHDKYRRLLWQRGIRPVIAKRGEPHGTGPGIFRYVVERTIAWLHGFRRLCIRWERRDDIHEA
ncbi:IS5 family transposase [Streptomyces coelicoflavus]|uniref:IS5 family transposase n=1 Tax=Streptomyces coelicoflavus TaxID=285562 RepID=UPI001941741D|nr:IS5 family transposase [Streptomyces coelicoflavus]